MRPKPTVLIILDGWGVASPSSGNAISQANPQFFNKMVNEFPTGVLQASGEGVGLGWGEMGNSEVGHLNIGAGRIVYQNLMKISKSIEDGSIYNNKALNSVINYVNTNNSQLHLIGLISDGGIHSHISHLYGLLEMIKTKNVKKVFIHAILDGRDTKYNDAINLISRLINKLKSLGIGKIATLSGRFYAMDRDNHWERIEKVYTMMTTGKAERSFFDPIEAISKSYEKENFDEEFIPTVITDKNKQALTTVQENDGVIFFNFRPDRARELTKAFVLPSFDKFKRSYLKKLKFVTLTEYEKGLPVEVAFVKTNIKNTLGEVISKNKLTQFHIAETEKYAHITYFLNGGREDPFPLEDNVIIPSPRVSSYAKAPEMSAKLITKRTVEEIIKDKYDFIAINFANTDMVGHTGDIPATIKAVKTVDSCLKEIVELVLIKDGAVVIVADHGNAEDMINQRVGEIKKEHTNNPVPFIVIKKDLYQKDTKMLHPIDKDLSYLRPVGVLADVAPTILKIMELEKSSDMNGISLI